MEVFRCDKCGDELKENNVTEVRVSQPGFIYTTDVKYHFCAKDMDSLNLWIKEFCSYDMNKDRSEPIPVVDENKLTEKENKKEEEVSGSTRI